MNKLYQLRKHTIESYVIVSNFEDTTEKKCIKLDRKNQQVYNELLNIANKANNTLKHSVLSMNIEVPLPPRPSNRDRLILWKKRNISRPVIDQSNAIVFLESKGYKLNQDYEAYQAIHLSKELKKTEGIVDIPDNNSKLFDNNIFTNTDNNFMRRRSVMRMNNTILEIKHEPEHEYEPKPEPETKHEQESFMVINDGFTSRGRAIKPSAPPLTRSLIYPKLGDNYIAHV